MNTEKLLVFPQKETIPQKNRRNIFIALADVGFNKIIYKPVIDACRAVNSSTTVSDGLTITEKLRKAICRKLGI